MAKVTWKGEDDLHNDDRGGPRHTTWSGIKFAKGVPVEITDEEVLSRARGNQFFEVAEGTAKEVAKVVKEAPKQAAKEAAKEATKSIKHDD